MIYNSKETVSSDSPMSVGFEHFDFFISKLKQWKNLSNQTYSLTNDAMNAFEKCCRF